MCGVDARKIVSPKAELSHREKADQAQQLLAEVGLDCWLTFARETSVRPDPGVEMVVGSDVTWNSAFILGRGGERVAIVGRYDAPDIRAAGIFTEVIGYDEGMREPLVAALTRLDPGSIGLNYSLDDPPADGPSHQSYYAQAVLIARAGSAGFCPSLEPWTIDGDTGIHPNRAGHAQLAGAALAVIRANGWDASAP